MRGKRLLLLIVLLVPAFAARASEKPLLIELSQRSGALPSGVSASGAIVVGALASGGGFYWMPTTGDIFIGGLGATNVSRDGSTIVGTVIESRVTQAATWVRGAEWRALGSLRPGAAPCDTSLSAATGTSRDGRIVVGYGYDGCGITHALRWEGSGVVDLGSSVAGRPSLALGVPAPRLRPSPGPPINVDAYATSDDGRVIGGAQGIGQDDTDAIVWIDRAPFYLKDYLRANGVPDAFETWVNTGSITDISPDGRIVVGKGAAAQGFRGYIVILGDLP